MLKSEEETKRLNEEFKKKVRGSGECGRVRRRLKEEGTEEMRMD